MSKDSLANITQNNKAAYIQAMGGLQQPSKAAQFSRNQANYMKQNQTYNPVNLQNNHNQNFPNIVSNNTSSKAKNLTKNKDTVFGFPGASQTFYGQKASGMTYGAEYNNQLPGQIRGNSFSKSNLSNVYGQQQFLNQSLNKAQNIDQLINQYNQMPINKNAKHIRAIKSRNQYVVNQEGGVQSTYQQPRNNSNLMNKTSNISNLRKPGTQINQSQVMNQQIGSSIGSTKGQHQPNIQSQLQNESKGHSRNKGRALASSGKRMLDHTSTQQIVPGGLSMVENKM